MAISDKYLPGNLNRAEMDTIKGIPMSVFDRLSREEQERILGLGSEERTVKGIPMSIFNTLSPEDQRQILGLSGNLNRAELDVLQKDREPTIKGVPRSIFDNLSTEQQRQILGLSGNLNRTEMDMLLGNEPSAGNFAEIKSLIGRLMAAGASRAEIRAAVQNLTRGNINPSEIDALIAAGASRNEISGADVGGRIAAGAPVSRFNQGGIVSLRHLTRPLGI
jgi:ABC-type transporter Mla MlaB component